MADAVVDRRARALITPEGVDLRVRLATFPERFSALLIDLVIILAAMIGLSILAAFALGKSHSVESSEAIAVIWLLGFFLVRNFYFTLFECSARAATPGKRVMRLRVAARNGKALSADAVVARNAMREIELYLPVTFLLIASGSQAGDVETWIIIFGLVWCLVFAFLPLFNRDGLRVGDIVAGTWVLQTPRQPLLADLAESEVKAAGQFAFTEAQLDVYGVHELQVLEQVLRIHEPNAMTAVADRIRAKINWTRRPLEDDGDFLTAYYQRLRARLEQRLLFGVRKKDKFDRTR